MQNTTLKNETKILLVSLSNSGGGASKIVASLFDGLQKKGFNVNLLIYEGNKGNNIKILNSNNKSRLIFLIKNYIVGKLFKIFKNPSTDYQSINIFPSKLLREINNSDASIVHLHWVGAEMISINQIKKIRKRLIWTMHDAWPLNGSYHIDPRDYIVEPKLKCSINKQANNFLDRNTLNRKIKNLANKEIFFTSPSRWLHEKYETSFYNKRISKCIVIPNFIDFSTWQPVEKKNARSSLGIETNKIILTFGASNIGTSINKGLHFILELMNLLSPDKYSFIIFGNEEKNIFSENFEIFHFGIIKDEEKMRRIYSAGDITVVPSLSESFSLVSLESISCNSPVLAFDTSGIRDIIIHKQNGYLAKKFEIIDLLAGIQWLSENKLKEINHTVLKFSKEIVLQKYIAVYHSLGNNKKDLTE